MDILLRRVIAAAAVLLAAGAGWGQTAQTGKIAVRSGGSSLPLAAGATPATMQEALLQMAAGAAVIFAGRVEQITRQDAAGYVDVRFRIDQAVRGCGGANVYVLREWAGLWAGGTERFKTGQRRLMLLTARGASGMSAPVGGMDGAIPLVATGVQPLANTAGVAPADTGAGAAGSRDVELSVGVDLRWVGAHVMRGAVSGAGSGATGTRGGAKRALSVLVVSGPDVPGGTDASSDEGNWSGPAQALSSLRNVDGSAGASPVALSYVLTLLQGTAGGGGAE